MYIISYNIPLGCKISSKPFTSVQYVIYTAIVYSAWRWLTKPKRVADDKLLIKLRLVLFFK